MHYVGKIDWSFADRPMPPSDTSSGLSRARIVGPEQGAVHTDLYAGAMDPGGWLAPHVHSYEEALYVLAGELLVQIDDRVHRVVQGDYVLFQIGMRHALGNSGSAQVRWLSLNSPLKREPGTPWPDTFFEPAQDLAAMDAAAARPPFGDPTLRFVGHYDGTPPQLDALRVADDPRRRAPVGMDIALLVYSGISVKMLIDKTFGADMVTMFTVDYEIGGAAQAHDHPFEEAYVFLAGEVHCELDGEAYTLHPGDVVFSGVGSVHGFWNEGTERVRWLETQAPQPPVRHAYRWAPSWERYDRQRTQDRREPDGS
jgi:quercetin dioxygenase-like cupin family protein